MKLTQVGPAALLTVLLGATWAVPAAVSKSVPTPTETVASGERITLGGPAGQKVAITPPAGWQTHRPTSDSSRTFFDERTDRQLAVLVLDGSTDFDTTADRMVRTLDQSGLPASFDGRQVTTRSGFSGKSCVAIDTQDDGSGPCAIVHRGKLVVAVVATGKSTEPRLDLTPVLDSLTVVKGD